MARPQVGVLGSDVLSGAGGAGPVAPVHPDMPHSRRHARIAASLLLSDFVSALIAASLVTVAFSGFASGGLPILVDGLAFVGLSALAGLYSGLSPSPIERVRMRALSVAALCAIELASGQKGFVGLTYALVLGGLLLGLSHYAELACRHLLEHAGVWTERVLVVGDGPRCERLIRDLTSQKLLGLKPVAVFAPGASHDAIPSRNGGPSIPIVSSLSDLSEPVDAAIAVSPLALQTFEKQAGGSEQVPRVLLLADGPMGESLWIPTRSLGTGIGVEVRRSLRLDRSPVLKRLLDLAIAGMLAVPTFFVVGICVALVKMVDPGPAFYVQRRIGKDGRPVDVLKIRTMYQDSERRLEQHLAESADARREWEQYFKLRNDPRILPVVGHLLRKSSLDELPQLWNVLKGDMSLVGPRPFPEYHLKMFDEEFRKLRTSVPPGLTGMWQVSTRSDGDLDVQKAEDLFYIRNRSIWLDLYIILQTIPALLSARGAR